MTRRTSRDIFVQIPSYRDPELPRTLRELYANAAHPESLHVVVAWQFAEQELIAKKIRELPGLEIIPIPHRESKGCNWARRLLQERYAGERYSLLLDSHHRFVIDMINRRG